MHPCSPVDGSPQLVSVENKLAHKVAIWLIVLLLCGVNTG
jgi:hypothetical protein